MGTCELLDYATEGFLAAHDDLRSGQKSRRTIEKCGKVLNLLHNALKDSRQLKSPYTLCAIFMLMIAEMWVSESAQSYMSHMQGICTLLHHTIDEPWHDSFGQDLRYHLIVPACIEAIINPNIPQIDLRYLHILNTRLGCYRPLDKEEGQAIESLDLPYLMRFSCFTRQPELHEKEMVREYKRMQIECPFVRRRLMDLTNMAKATRKTNTALVRAQIQMGVAYTMILSFTLMINAFISAMDPTSKRLQEEALLYAREAIWITRILSKQLPVGAGFMPAALFAAWVATDDDEVIEGIESTIKQHKSYWAEPQYVEHFTTLKKRVGIIRNRRLVELRAGGLRGMDVTAFTTANGPEYNPWGRDAPFVDTMSLHNGNPRMMISGASCVPEPESGALYNWDFNFAALAFNHV
ncbi:hypothetical protein ISF_07131 [Cordyceps fumosorosea ARSEF 2679]|uniref:Uncharacterized protein n=1 Tax=Cordyceps fumosorosea (strain ARSEF 2679) TaxID=1081104 RepID=A0A167Q1X8_CORFA|nr:hypothetical protein ISF_07131 [Cordyceps fumosorosea ARSEF 2679]OAA57210.1 hypothetical protein ISF_07131 [Cordyceps fumosorosea ARSEF 2679]